MYYFPTLYLLPPSVKPSLFLFSKASETKSEVKTYRRRRRSGRSFRAVFDGSCSHLLGDAEIDLIHIHRLLAFSLASCCCVCLSKFVTKLKEMTNIREVKNVQTATQTMEASSVDSFAFHSWVNRN